MLSSSSGSCFSVCISGLSSFCVLSGFSSELSSSMLGSSSWSCFKLCDCERSCVGTSQSYFQLCCCGWSYFSVCESGLS